MLDEFVTNLCRSNHLNHIHWHYTCGWILRACLGFESLDEVEFRKNIMWVISGSVVYHIEAALQLPDQEDIFPA